MADIPSPYKFLNFYDLDDHVLFFGREKEIKILLADVVVRRFVVLFAKTGTGKTSLINAGVRPLLHERGYETFFIRVERDPIQSARAAISSRARQTTPVSGAELATELEELADELGKPIVLFFDQFEEFFLYTVKDNHDAARRFIANLAEIHYDDESQVHVVLSMREEFFVELDLFRDEIPDIFHEESNLRLRWFDEGQATDAIVRPALLRGVTVEPDLVTVLLSDLAHTGRTPAAATPTPRIEPAQLQIVCDTLWANRQGSRLTLEEYNSLATRREGSVAQQILERRLEKNFEQLESEEQLQLLERLLPLLRTDRNTKRIWDFASLRQELAADDEEPLRLLLSQLGRSYLIKRSTREGPDVIELTHDYFVERLDDLTQAARTIWPLRLLRTAMRGPEGAQGGGDTRAALDFGDLVKIIEHIETLPLDAAEGRFLLRAAVQNRVDLWRIVTPIQSGGVDVWGELRGHLREADDETASYLLRTLARLATPEALAMLRDAMTGGRAWELLQVLVEVGTPEAYSVLEIALESGWLSGHRISRLGFKETQTAVTFYARALTVEPLATEARKALQFLARSQRQDVAIVASRALQATAPDQSARRRRRDPSSTGRATRDWSLPRGGPTDSHYQLVGSEVLAGRVVPFLGAGVNLCGRPEELTWRPGQFDWLPSGRELSSYLASMFDYEGRNEDDLLRVSTYVTLTVGAWPLYEELRRLFDGDYPPTALHRFLASVPSITSRHGDPPAYQLIVTTTFDDMLERAFRDAGEPFDVVRYDAEGEYRGKFLHYPHNGTPQVISDPSRYFDVSTDERTVILKVFGGVDRTDPTRDSFVITEDHYIDYLVHTGLSMPFPVTLVEQLRRSHCLFLGYSLRDWNLRVILKRIWGEAEMRSRSWAVQRNPDPIDVGLWHARDVQIFDTPLEDYLNRLHEALASD
jgi:hypothetical protein